MGSNSRTSMITTITTVLIISCFAAVTLAIPMSGKRDVFDPPITSPGLSTVWTVGENETVTWNVTGLPVENATGIIMLGYLDDGSSNEHLMSPALAEGFLLSDQQVIVTVPSVPPGDNYIIVLFGDSGNASPEFTIQNATTSSSTTSLSSSLSTSSSSGSPPVSTPTSLSSSTETLSTTTPPLSSPTSTDTTTTIPPTSTAPASSTSSPEATPSLNATSNDSCPVTSSTPTSPLTTLTPASTQTSSALEGPQCSLTLRLLGWAITTLIFLIRL